MLALSCMLYFTTIESVIMHRNTCRPCYVSKRLIGAFVKA